MIYMEPQQLGIDSLFQSWLVKKVPDVVNADQKKIIEVRKIALEQLKMLIRVKRC